MPLLNYTTTISPDRTVAEIQRLLAKAGASAILTEYDQNGYIVALSFRLKFGDNELSFRLPTDWRPVQQTLQTQLVGQRYQTQEHALRVSWRIVKDWVEAQLAIIESRQVTTAQVFLPYAVTASGQSLYEYMGQHASLLLGGGEAA